MIQLTAILSSISPILDFLKKHWRITFEAAAIVWIVICCLTHCGTRQATPKVDVKPIPSIEVRAVDIPTPIFEPNPAPIFKPWDVTPPAAPDLAATDSVKYLLELVDWFQDQLYTCDSIYLKETQVREYEDLAESDSANVSWHIKVAGELVEPPHFVIYPNFPPQVLPTKDRGLYLGGSIGPRLTYSKPVAFHAVYGTLEIGWFDRKGWSYGIRGGADQYNWDVQLSFTRRFAIKPLRD